MRILIVENPTERAQAWRDHLEGLGHDVILAAGESAAIDAIRFAGPDVIVLDLALAGGAALVVARFASIFRPAARVVLVSGLADVSDPGVFSLAANASAVVSATVSAPDLAAIAEYHGARAVSA